MFRKFWKRNKDVEISDVDSSELELTREELEKEVERLDKIHEEMFGEQYLTEFTIGMDPNEQIREIKECIRKKKPYWVLYPYEPDEYS